MRTIKKPVPPNTKVVAALLLLLHVVDELY